MFTEIFNEIFDIKTLVIAVGIMSVMFIGYKLGEFFADMKDKDEK